MIAEAREAFKAGQQDQMYKILEEPIKDSMKYLNKVFEEITGKKPDPKDIFNAVVWAMESYLAGNHADEINNPDAVNIAAIEFLSAICLYKRLPETELKRRAEVDNDTVASYILAVHPKVSPAPKKSGFFDQLVKSFNTPVVRDDKNKYPLSLL